MSNVISLESHRPGPEPAGFAQTSKVWLRRWFTDRRLTSGEKQICVCIYLHFNSDYFKETRDLLAWPSWQTLMDDTGLKRSCVHKGLRRLKELEAFDIERSPYNHEKKKLGPNRYIVRTRKVHADGPSKGKQGPLSKEQGPRRGPSKVHGDSTVSGESNRSGESRSKKEENSKIGLPREPTAPEEESKQSSTDSSKPSLQSVCEVPAADGPARPLRLIVPSSTDMELVERYGRKKFWRNPDGTYLLTEAEYTAICEAVAS